MCFHPSLGIPLIITGTTRSGCTGSWKLFPSLFRDSSDHHAVLVFMLIIIAIMFPSLFRDSSDHHVGTGLLKGRCPSVSIPL